ncbi:MAG: ATP-binding cassette domain-containing protein [Anaerolineales bacterium]|nr:ATP-binding cassette domain-containing protein [Anaerolineales bacterium]
MATLITSPVRHISSAPAVQLEDVSVRFHDHFALRDVTFELPPSMNLAVVGPNGAGKTTLFQVIAGMLKPTTGMVEVYGYKPGGHVCIAYVPQRSQVDWDFPVTVTEVVMMGRIRKIGLFNWPRRNDWDLVQTLLERVGLVDLDKRQIGELSGGQQQRVFLAQALAQEAELILLDEPLTGLDLPSQEAILEILDDFREEEVTVLVATHDLDMAAQHFDRVMLLNRELVSYGKPTEALTSSSLLTAYGAHMHTLEEEGGVVILSDPCAEEEDGCN